MKWQKKGLIFAPTGEYSWSQTHAQVPVVDYIKNDNLIRVYFATRNQNNQSVISYIEVDPKNPNNILYVHSKPILSLGRVGTFDDSGVMPSWIINVGDKKYLYYIGWNVRNTIPYHNSIGLAISEDDGKTFKRFSEGPLWDRNYIEPYFSASTCVLKEGKRWRSWYLSCTEFREINGKVEPRYHIKYAESKNGIDWIREGKIAIDYLSDQEAGLVKASVVKNKDYYEMWYSYRKFNNYRTDISNSYKIGYAFSNDGINWQRMDDKVGINLSDKGWDSAMQCYPHVIDVLDKRLMFYNGNGFGKSGFGYAELIEE